MSAVHLRLPILKNVAPNGLGIYRMHITLTHLLTGFTAAMTVHELAAHLGVPVSAVRDRFRALTPAEERIIHTEMEGR